MVYKNIWVWPGFYTGLRVLTILSGPDQTKELSVFDNDNGNLSPDSPQDFWGLTVQLQYFEHSSLYNV